MLYHRTTHKNGRVGNWVLDYVSGDPKMIKLCVESDRRRAERLGKTVEHKIQAREVGSWHEDDLNKVLKLAENEGVKNA